MCRKVAVELENCAPDDPKSDEEYQVHVHGGEIQISRLQLESLLCHYGGIGITPGVEEEVQFNTFNQIIISRYELGRILEEQGCQPFSDAQWQHLMSVYPVEEEEEEDEEEESQTSATGGTGTVAQVRIDDVFSEMVAEDAATTAARLALLPSTPTFYNSVRHACPLTVCLAGHRPPSYDEVECDICERSCVASPFYHCQDCEFDICAACFSLPSEEVCDTTRVSLHRADIQRLLEKNGSMATVSEFFNEDDECEQTLVANMTLASLNARLKSLGACPITSMGNYIQRLEVSIFSDGSRSAAFRYEVPRYPPILNPEDDPELGPH